MLRKTVFDRDLKRECIKTSVDDITSNNDGYVIGFAQTQCETFVCTSYKENHKVERDLFPKSKQSSLFIGEVGLGSLDLTVNNKKMQTNMFYFSDVPAYFFRAKHKQ